jgi:hypothetical protein
MEVYQSRPLLARKSMGIISNQLNAQELNLIFDKYLKQQV